MFLLELVKDQFFEILNGLSISLMLIDLKMVPTSITASLESDSIR